LLILKLEKETFTEVCSWPPKLRDKHVLHLLVSFIAHAIDMMFWNETDKLRRAVNKSLYKQIEAWACEPQKIAPYLYNHIIERIALQ
jgi:hypothetical protein